MPQAAPNMIHGVQLRMIPQSTAPWPWCAATLRADVRMIVASDVDGDKLSYTFFDPKTQATWDAVTRAFKNERVSLASWSRDRRKVVVEVDSAAIGPGYALVDLDAKTAKWLGMIYRDVPAAGVSPGHWRRPPGQSHHKPAAPTTA